MDDTQTMPATGAAVELHHETYHDAPEGYTQRRAYFGARQYRREFADLAAKNPDPSLPVRAGEWDPRLPTAQEKRVARMEAAAAALPAVYRQLFRSLGAAIVVHGRAYTHVYPDRAGSTNPDTGAKAEDLIGTWDANLAEVYQRAGEATLQHEIGHAVDQAVGKLRGGVSTDTSVPGFAHKQTWRSLQPDFVAIYNKHKDNKDLWDYMRTTPYEMFAEAFARYHGQPWMRDALRGDAPELAQFFDGLQKEIAGYAPRQAD
jgi:hypothetical protein